MIHCGDAFYNLQTVYTETTAEDQASEVQSPDGILVVRVKEWAFLFLQVHQEGGALLEVPCTRWGMFPVLSNCACMRLPQTHLHFFHKSVLSCRFRTLCQSIGPISMRTDS